MKVDFASKQNYDIHDLVKIMEILRSPDGCPWDREQTHTSIRKNLIEESYEVAEAIDQADNELLCEELGDLLLQVVFHSQMEAERNEFDFGNVCDGICKKLILRHPHIFSDVVANTSDEVLKNWDEIKKQEKGHTTATQTLRSVPSVLPALMRAQKVQSRAAKTGFDYPDVRSALEDLHSEVEELLQAIDSQTPQRQSEELGDLLFSAVNVSRFIKTDPEEALTGSTERFINRFEEVERIAAECGVEISGQSIEQLNVLWAQAKKRTK